MKVIVASFQCESNSKASLHPQKSDFEYFAGDDIFKKLVVKDILEKAGFEIVPSIYANALPSATVERHIYEHYKEQIISTVRANPDADGFARVTQKDAHAWTEIYFPGFGWLSFDPTPGAGGMPDITGKQKMSFLFN